jgi:hypothetical protein
MIDTRLIFVDGIPGSGKTTLVHWLGDLLPCHGISTAIYDESCPNHPLRIYDPIYTDFTIQAQSVEFRTRSLHLYRQFVNRMLSESTVSVFDGWLFQAVIGFTFLLRMAYTDSFNFAFDLFDIIAPLSPTVVFLAQTDVEANWRRICSIRGPKFTEGRCGLMKDRDFWEAGVVWSANQEYFISLLKRSGLRQLVLHNVDYNYDLQGKAVTKFLGVEDGLFQRNS